MSLTLSTQTVWGVGTRRWGVGGKTVDDGGAWPELGIQTGALELRGDGGVEAGQGKPTGGGGNLATNFGVGGLVSHRFPTSL